MKFRKAYNFEIIVIVVVSTSLFCATTFQAFPLYGDLLRIPSSFQDKQYKKRISKSSRILPVFRQATLVINISDEEASDVSLVGGKAASLHDLAQIEGVQVPEAFCVIVEAYDNFVVRSTIKPLIIELENLSEEWIKVNLGEKNEVDIGKVEGEIHKKSKQIREAMEMTEVASEIEKLVKLKYRALCNELDNQSLSVAVRSSATAEDLPVASFAGQQDTFLNIIGEDQIMDAIKKCWISLYGDRAVDYRNQQRLMITTKEGNKEQIDSMFKHSQVKLCVVIQRIIEAAVAGVGFNIDVATGKSGVRIEANYGFGELVVSGKVNPDSWFLDEKSFEILERAKGDKEKKAVGDKKSGTKIIDTSKEERERFALEDDMVKEVARTIVKIADYYAGKFGYKFIDTEFVVDDNGGLYFVQARPETVWSRKKGDQNFVINGVPIDKARDAEILFCGGRSGYLGAVSGRLTIVSNLQEALEKVKAGDILVTVKTHPEWNAVISKSAGVAVDIGGTTSHTAIVSREYGKPSILACGNITEKLKDYNGEKVTLDTVNGIIYHGELPLTQGSVQDFVRQDISKQAEDLYAAPPHKVEEGRKWLGKPEYPLAGFQLDLYLDALQQLKDQFDPSLEIRVEDGIIYVDQDKLMALVYKWREWPIEKLEAQFHERKELLERFIYIAEHFEVTEEYLYKLRDIYTRLIAHFHVRWGVGALVLEYLQNEQLAQFPKELHPLILQSFVKESEKTETKKMEEDYHSILGEARQYKSYFAVSSVDMIEKELREKAPTFFDRIAQHARKYKYDKDDIRLPIPIAKVLMSLKKDIDEGAIESKKTTVSKVTRPIEIPDLRNRVVDYDLFVRTLKLAYEQTIQKENEHHLQVRSQWVIRDRFLEFADALVKINVLSQREDIFEISFGKLLELVKKYGSKISPHGITADKIVERALNSQI